MVYIKDKAGRYTLVNTRYEELFNVRNPGIQGKTDYDILPKAVADQFRASDSKVLVESRSLQVEEQIQQSEGLHTYLAVKFPIYDESDMISGVCGILNDITAVKKAQHQLRRLSGSIKTIDTYRARLLKKLGLRNNAELSRFAIQNQLIEA